MPPAKPTRIYAIPVEWTAFGVMYLEAPSLAAAIEMAETADLPRTDCQDCEDFRVRLEVVRDNAAFFRAHPTHPEAPDWPLTADDTAWLTEEVE